MSQEHLSNFQATLKITVKCQGQKVTWKTQLAIDKVFIIRLNKEKVEVPSTPSVGMKRSIKTKKFKK